MPRPRSVTLLALWISGLGAFHFLGAVSGIQRYTYLSGARLSLPPIYLIASSLIWSLVFLALAAGLWQLKSWGRVGTLAAFPLYVAQGWLDRLAFSRSDYAQVTIPWAVLWSLVSLALVWGILLRGKVRQSFSG